MLARRHRRVTRRRFWIAAATPNAFRFLPFRRFPGAFPECECRDRRGRGARRPVRGDDRELRSGFRARLAPLERPPRPPSPPRDENEKLRLRGRDEAARESHRARPVRRPTRRREAARPARGTGGRRSSAGHFDWKRYCTRRMAAFVTLNLVSVRASLSCMSPWSVKVRGPATPRRRRKSSLGAGRELKSEVPRRGL